MLIFSQFDSLLPGLAPYKQEIFFCLAGLFWIAGHFKWIPTDNANYIAGALFTAGVAALNDARVTHDTQIKELNNQITTLKETIAPTVINNATPPPKN